MAATTKTENPADKSQALAPAKGGTKPAHEDTCASRDSPKPHGDPLLHLIEEEPKK
jgi:hypothetical protein